MMFGGGMILGWLLPIILLIVGGAWLVNGLSGNRQNDTTPRGHGSVETSEEILKQRYARGEVSREEFEAMRETLRQ